MAVHRRDLTVLIAGGSRRSRQGLAVLLAYVPEVGVSVEQEPGASLARAVAYRRPDVLLLERAPSRSGQLALTGLAAIAKQVPTVIVTDRRLRLEQIGALARLGVVGVLDTSHDCDTVAVAEAIRSALEDFGGRSAA